jgi:hypothetical protein
MRKLRSLTFLGISIGLGASWGALGACEGTVPPSPVTPDAPPGDAGETLTGHTLDFRTGQPLDSASIATDGIDPAQSTTSGSDGAYELDHVPTGSKVFLQVTRTNYRTTRSAAIAIGTSAVMQDVPIVSDAYFRAQYTQLGKQPTAGKGILLLDLVRTNGMPLEGIPITDITVLDSTGQAVTAPINFIGSAGDLDPSVTVATAFNGRSRAIVLDLAPGTYTVNVVHPAGTGSGSGLDAGIDAPIDAPIDAGSGSDAGIDAGTGSGATDTETVTITAVADGAVLAASSDGMGSTTGDGPADPQFSVDIYPRLQGAAAGGLGCGDCHTPELNAYVYTGTPSDVLATLMAGSGSGAEGSNTPIVDLANPKNSLLLQRPLYELPPLAQDHPNATFLDTNDPDYKLFLRWITNGAKP